MRELILDPISPETAFSTFSAKLEWAKKRVDLLEQYRIQNALEHNDEAFKQVFSFIALFLHYNDPNLPGFVENAPMGISHFHVNEEQIAYLQQYPFTPKPPSAFCFDGLYAMGSTGSITQTAFSDLDLWLCHSQRFTPCEQRLIQRKLDLIKQWAMDLGVEVNFYLMNPDVFQTQNYSHAIGDEHNGSAQHFFLLDEFYRSAIRLAGKRILWLHIDIENENYQNQITQAVKNGQLNTKDWVDFGDFSALSSNEFLGAALWQLYKGIKSPYKSAIKILLLESYTKTYPKIALISQQFKQLLLTPRAVRHHFDPYLAMLEMASEYLQKSHSVERLQLLRCCFYIKAKEGQKSLPRCCELRQLCTQWQWKNKETQYLENRLNWRVREVENQHKRLIEQLLQSYRTLLQFAREQQLKPSILPQDIDFLMRQLYSAFENIHGKVELLNEKGDYHLAEPQLTFIDVAQGSSVKAGWYILNHAPFSYDSVQRNVHYEVNITRAVAWAYFNGVLTEKSQLHLVSPEGRLAALRQFITDLHASFPIQAPKIQREAFNHPNEIRNLIVAINLTKDPTTQIKTLSNKELEQLDLFNLTPSKQGVIGSISIIYRNMLNQIIARHFEKEGALLKALKLISNKIYLSSAPPESVKVFCYSEKFTEDLQQFVLRLVNRCITVKTGSIFQRYQPQVVQLRGKKWQLVFDDQQAPQQLIESEKKPNQWQDIPHEVCNFASEGFLQFFFDDTPNSGFHVYVLDKQNKAECYYHCYGKKEERIRTISRLYAEEIRLKNQQEMGSFNFPQFYQLLRKKAEIIIVPFQSKQHRDFLEEQD